MGYYTRHELTVSDGFATDYLDDLESISGYQALFEDEIKWYDHERDMRKLSDKHPNILFTLKGDGEEQGDQWIEYHKAGKMQREKAVITFGEFDESKLA